MPGHDHLAFFQRQPLERRHRGCGIQTVDFRFHEPGGLARSGGLSPPAPVRQPGSINGTVAHHPVQPRNRVIRDPALPRSLRNASCTTSSGSEHHCRAHSTSAAAFSSISRARSVGLIFFNDDAEPNAFRETAIDYSGILPSFICGSHSMTAFGLIWGGLRDQEPEPKALN